MSPEKIDQYLKKQKLCQITEEESSIMNGLITIREMVEAIKKIKLGKVPCPDDLLGLYYKCFEDKLLQPLQSTMYSGKMLPLERRQIPKEGQAKKLNLL